MPNPTPVELSSRLAPKSHEPSLWWGKVKIITAPVEKTGCGSLADKYKVKRTPIAIFFGNDGKEKKRIPIAGKTWTEVKQGLAKLVAPSSQRTANAGRASILLKHRRRRSSRSAEQRHAHSA